MYYHRHLIALTIGILFSFTACTSPEQKIVEVFDTTGSSLGRVAIDATCSSAANEHLRRGLALLHNMTYSGAEDEFRAASDADAGCALAKWGEATTLFHPLWPDVPTDETLVRGQQLLADARSVDPGDHVSAYLSAAAAYYSGDSDRSEVERLASYSAAWEDVVAQYPDDIEAKLFLVLSKIATSGTADDPIAARQAAGEMAEAILEEVPDHPGALHYSIHAFDEPQLAEQGLDEAHQYGKVAPENSHALHMTSHIFTRVGAWEESIEYNARAADAALKSPVRGSVSMHHLHASDYLVYAYLQRGDDARAEAVWQDMRAIEDPVQNHAGTAYAYAAVPARLALERHDWETARDVTLASPDGLIWEQYPHLEAIVAFARGMGNARTGQLAEARKSAARMQTLESAAASLPGAYDWSTQVEIQRRALNAWITFEAGDREAALDEMRAAAELEATTTKNPVTPGEVLPAAELLGDMLLAMDKPAEAVEAYEQSLARNSNRLNSLYGAALASEQTGDDVGAQEYYDKIVAMADDSSDVEAVREAMARMSS